MSKQRQNMIESQKVVETKWPVEKADFVGPNLVACKESKAVIKRVGSSFYLRGKNRKLFNPFSVGLNSPDDEGNGIATFTWVQVDARTHAAYVEYLKTKTLVRFHAAERMAYNG